VGLLRHLRLGAPPTREHAEHGLAHQAALSTAGVLVQGAVRFLYSVLVGNVLGQLVLGRTNSSIALAMLASLLVPSATAMAATKYVARYRGAQDLAMADRAAHHLGRVTQLSMLGLAVGAAVLAVPILRLGPLDAVLCGALAAAYSGYVYVRGFLFGAGHTARATVWDGVSAGLAMVGLATVLVFELTSWLLVPLILCYAAYTVASWPRSSGPLPADVRREMRGFLWLTLVNTVAVGGFLQLTMVAAQHWDPGTAGAFAAALSLATPASLASRSLTLVLFPSMAAAEGRGDLAGAIRQTDLATRGLAVVSLATFGPLMLVSPALIGLFYRRPEFEPAKVLLPILLGAVMLTNLAVAAMNSLLSRDHRHGRRVLVASVVGALVGGLWWIARVPGGGVLEIAIGFLVGSAVVGLMPIADVWRRDGHRWALPAARFTLGSTVVVALCVLEQRGAVGVLGQVGLALVFMLGWLALSYRDVGALTRVLRS
jgi:O-antigen/teichoic acid export membrane protein